MTFGADGGDQRSGCEQHHHHGDNASREAGAATVTVTNSQWVERKPGQWVHLLRRRQ